MKKKYDTPFLEIEYFDLSEALLAYSNGTDFIPDTDEDDWFGDL